MCLVLFQVESGDGLEVRDGEDYMASLDYGTDVVPEFPSVVLEAGCGQLQFADDPEVLAYAVACDPEGYLQVLLVDDSSGCDLKMNDREVG